MRVVSRGVNRNFPEVAQAVTHIGGSSANCQYERNPKDPGCRG